MSAYQFINHEKAHRRRADALRAYKSMLGELSSQLQPGEIAFEPRNYRDWMQKADNCSKGLLQSMIDMLTTTIGNARTSSFAGDKHSELYVKVRTPFLEYAQGAMARRFKA